MLSISKSFTLSSIENNNFFPFFKIKNVVRFRDDATRCPFKWLFFKRYIKNGGSRLAPWLVRVTSTARPERLIFQGQPRRRRRRRRTPGQERRLGTRQRGGGGWASGRRSPRRCRRWRVASGRIRSACRRRWWSSGLRRLWGWRWWVPCSESRRGCSACSGRIPPSWRPGRCSNPGYTGKLRSGARELVKKNRGWRQPVDTRVIDPHILIQMCIWPLTELVPDAERSRLGPFLEEVALDRDLPPIRTSDHVGHCINRAHHHRQGGAQQQKASEPAIRWCPRHCYRIDFSRTWLPDAVRSLLLMMIFRGRDWRCRLCISWRRWDGLL